MDSVTNVREVSSRRQALWNAFRIPVFRIRWEFVRIRSNRPLSCKRTQSFALFPLERNASPHTPTLFHTHWNNTCFRTFERLWDFARVEIRGIRPISGKIKGILEQLVEELPMTLSKRDIWHKSGRAKHRLSVGCYLAYLQQFSHTSLEARTVGLGDFALSLLLCWKSLY